jgi:hypothetical protein
LPLSRFYSTAKKKLADLGVMRLLVKPRLGIPDRIEMRDLEPGETGLILNSEQLPTESPMPRVSYELRSRGRRYGL